jgi:uncharacterized membrane protein YagU involved in acid resistance
MRPFQGFARGPSEALERILEKGVFFGVLASIPMGLFAMAASATYQGRGFYTPAYHVAFTVDPNTMGLSLERAAAGERFFFSHEAFIFGLAFHVILAGIFGVVFALLAMRFRLPGNQILVGGLVYGLAVMVLMSALVLPVAGSAFCAGDPISRMGSEVGWPTFTALHAIFGLALGGWVYVRPQDLEG